MAVFSDAGIKFLKDLLAKISELLPKTTVVKKSDKKEDKKEDKNPTQEKNATQEMLETVRNIVKAFIDHNSITYWSSSDNQKWLISQLKILSGREDCHAPQVFNDITRKLAQIILQALSSFKISTHVKSYVKAALDLFVGDLSIALKKICDQTEFHLKVHEIVLTQNTTAIAQFEDGLKHLISECEPAVAELKTTDEKKISADEKQSQLKTLQQHYEKRAETLLCQLTKMSYICLANQSDSTFLSPDAATPYSWNSIKINSNRLQRIRTLLQFEMSLNQELIKARIDFRLTYFFEYFRKHFSDQHRKGLEAQIVAAIAESKVHFSVFKADGANQFFKKGDADKHDFVSQIYQCLHVKAEEEKKQEPVMTRCESISQRMLAIAAQMRATVIDATKLNKHAFKESHYKNLWNCAGILEKKSLEFLSFPLFHLNESNDTHVFDALAEAGELLKQAVVMDNPVTTLGLA
jgi:hypothetical protein